MAFSGSEWTGVTERLLNDSIIQIRRKEALISGSLTLATLQPRRRFNLTIAERNFVEDAASCAHIHLFPRLPCIGAEICPIQVESVSMAQQSDRNE